MACRCWAMTHSIRDISAGVACGQWRRATVIQDSDDKCLNGTWEMTRGQWHMLYEPHIRAAISAAPRLHCLPRPPRGSLWPSYTRLSSAQHPNIRRPTHSPNKGCKRPKVSAPTTEVSPSFSGATMQWPHHTDKLSPPACCGACPAGKPTT